MKDWRKGFGWVCAAIITPCLSLPCSAAMLTELSRQPMSWFSGVPQIDSSQERPAVAATESRLVSSISAEDLAKLSTHDVVLIIDKSRSMSKTDCASAADSLNAATSDLINQPCLPVSRWQWCQEQTLDLTKKTQGALPAGITVELFAEQTVIYNNVNAKDIENIFTVNHPRGNTNTALALKNQLRQYFDRRNRLGDLAKPLLLVVVTDGCPNEPSTLRYAIIDATQQMRTREEISITFLQVGNDANGGKILSELDQRLIEQKAKFDIVDVKPFAEVSKIGLASALVSELGNK